MQCAKCVKHAHVLWAWKQILDEGIRGGIYLRQAQDAM